MPTLRPIKEKDDPQVAALVRSVLTEFGANRPGFAWQDPELDYMTRAYASPGCFYWVVAEGDTILGGGGIAPFTCEQDGICELQKMYLQSAQRSKGLGKQLMAQLLAEARAYGYKKCYLETLSSMTSAKALYVASGFEALAAPLGDSGHNACDEWYLLDL